MTNSWTLKQINSLWIIFISSINFKISCNKEQVCFSKYSWAIAPNQKKNKTTHFIYSRCHSWICGLIFIHKKKAFQWSKAMKWFIFKELFLYALIRAYSKSNRTTNNSMSLHAILTNENQTRCPFPDPDSYSPLSLKAGIKAFCLKPTSFEMEL